MKKLMNTMASAAVALLGFGAFADLPSPSATFEGLSTGDKTVSALVTNDDAGSSEGAKYWFAVTNDSQALDAVIGVVTNETGRGNYFAMETSAPLYRTINSTTSQYGRAFDDAADAEPIGSDGIYLDTMVKFTVSSDDEFKDLDAGVDKLAITCYSPDVNENESSDTNILVRAGYVDGSTITATNYTLNLPQNFKIDEWHRLTVRAIADVGYEYAPVGFAIYLDEELLTYSTAVDAGESAYVASLNAAVKQNLYNSETHALLPSLIDYTYNDCSVLSAVGFKGTGSVDDILFTDDKPSFIVEGQTVTIAWDAGVATYTVVDSNNKTLVDAASTSGAVSTNLTLDAGVTYLTVTATYANGYEAGTWTKSAGTLSNDVWTFAENGATLTIVSMLPLYEVNGVAYDDLEDAIAAAANEGSELAPATFKLLADCEEGITLTGESTFVIIDLAGHYIQGTDEQSFTISCKQGATVIVTNSIPATGSVKVSLMEDAAVAMQVRDTGTEVSVYDTKFEGYIQVKDAGSLKVYSGIFYDDEATGVEDFRYNAYLQNTPTVTSIGNDYYQVGGSTPEPPAPTSVEVPAAETGLVYDGTEKIGVVAGTGYTLTGNIATNVGNYTATATLEEGYIWSDSTTAAKLIDWSIAVNSGATVDLTLASEIAEYSELLEFPVVTSAKVGTEDVTGMPEWSPAKISEPNAGETNTYTVTFTVMNGGYTGSTGTATFKVYKTAGGEYPTYIDPSDTETKAKYDTWKETYGADTGSAYEDAFLLNCAPADVETAKANFKATITVNADGTVTVTAPGDYNVTPTIQGKQTLSNTEEWHTKTDGDKFFRAVLSL